MPAGREKAGWHRVESSVFGGCLLIGVDPDREDDQPHGGRHAGLEAARAALEAARINAAAREQRGRRIRVPHCTQCAVPTFQRNGEGQPRCLTCQDVDDHEAERADLEDEA